MTEVIFILIAIGILWNFYDDYRQQHPKKMELPPTPKKPKKRHKPNPDNNDYNINKDWFKYSPDLVKLNNYRQYKKDYLDSPKWRTKRKLTIERDGYKCVACETTKNLQVHHLRYKDIPNEPITDLLTLCNDCHKHLHDTIGYPKVYQDYMTQSYLPPWK